MRTLFALGLLAWSCAAAFAAPLDLQQINTSVSLANTPSDTIVISTRERRLFYKTRDGQMIAYPVAVGKAGRSWSGNAIIKRMLPWPDWTPTPAMRKERPWLPKRMAGGPGNPLGARALYLYQGPADTGYRIHGSNSPDSIGYATTAGCIRMFDEDVEVLYSRVSIGTKVVVLLH